MAVFKDIRYKVIEVGPTFLTIKPRKWYVDWLSVKCIVSVFWNKIMLHKE